MYDYLNYFFNNKFCLIIRYENYIRLAILYSFWVMDDSVHEGLKFLKIKKM